MYKIMSNNLTDIKAIEQIEGMARIFDNENMVIMPDYHAGKGCVVGTTMLIKDRVCPNHIGVDIGCGVYGYRIDKSEITFDENKLKELDKIIRDFIPSGRNVCSEHDEVIDEEIGRMLSDIRMPLSKEIIDRASLSLGTLGGGNHFIELGETKDSYYLFVHTGSRNLGVQVATYYQRLAENTCNEKINQRMVDMLPYVPKESRQQFIDNYKNAHPIIPKEHCYLTGKEMQDYLHDMRIVQRYADNNRLRILNTILFHLGMYMFYSDIIMTAHNYIDYNNILRKGSISAYEGEKVLIPLNMRDGVILGTGKGNPDWNYSAPHGAGRIYSRRDAKADISMEDYRKSMEGIFSTCVNENTLDESPMAYKPMDEILSVIGDTVEIIDIIKPIYNFKAND